MYDKEVAIAAIRQLPASVRFEEIAEEIAILAAIQRGVRDVDAGRIVPHGEVKKRLHERARPATG